MNTSGNAEINESSRGKLITFKRLVLVVKQQIIKDCTIEENATIYIAVCLNEYTFNARFYNVGL